MAADRCLAVGLVAVAGLGRACAIGQRQRRAQGVGQQVARATGVGAAEGFINPQPGQQIGLGGAGVPAVAEAAVCVTGIDKQVSHTCFLGGFAVSMANP